MSEHFILKLMKSEFTVFLVLLPLVIPVYGQVSTGQEMTTDFNEFFDFTCNSKQGLYAFNGNEYDSEVHFDRTFTFKCKDVAKEIDNKCYTSNELNRAKEKVDFECKKGEFIGGVISNHLDDDEDRIWKVKCCKNPELELFDCKKSYYTNDWRESFKFELTDNIEYRVITGIHSIQRSYNELDRKWKFYHCRTKARPQSTKCNEKNAISRFHGTYSLVSKDRKWNFECGGHAIVSDNVNCYWSTDTNFYDLALYYRCESNFYINAIESYGSNYYHDRVYRFRCCSGNDFEVYGCKKSAFNDFQDKIDVNTKGRIIQGLESHHDNVKEDRRWKLEICEYGRHIIEMECPSGHGIHRVQSIYNPGRSDRSWSFECKEVIKSSFDNCYWTDYTDYVNDYLNIECDVLTGIKSLFNTNLQRRVMKVRCCSSKTLELGECTKTKVNGLQEGISYEVSGSNTIVTGLESFYNDDKKDAVWKVRSCMFMERSELSFECQESFGLSYMKSAYFRDFNDRLWTFGCTKVTETEFEDCNWLNKTYINDYDKEMKAECPTNYVITAVKSMYSINHGDRQWNFKCCKPKDDSVVISKCITTPYVNLHQQNLEIALNEDRVITGLESYHDNNHEDRQWKAKICQFKNCSTKLS